ncbi:MAG: flagellar filament capping protein FliD [Pseudomonadota bacterium]
MITAQGLGSGLDVGSIVSQLVAVEGQATTERLARREASFQLQLSGLGSFRSALSTFRDSVRSLSDTNVFQSRRANSDNEDVFTATASTSAVPASYDVEVLSTASAQKLATGPYANSDTLSFGAGVLTFQNGSDTSTRFTIEIDAENSTLADIRDAINSAVLDADGPNDEPGVNSSIRASLVNADDGTRLVLNSTLTGEENQITVTASAGDYDFLTYGPDATGSTLTELSAAADARIRVDGFEISNSTNRFTDVADGVNITVASADVGNTATLEVAFDRGRAVERVNEFVDAYNSLVDTFAALSSFDETTGASGALFGDATLRNVASALRREVGGGGTFSDGSYRSLTRAGVTTELDGKLTVDSSALSQALDADFDAVASLFGGDEGFATRLTSLVDPLVESGGPIDNRTDGLESSIDLIADQRAALSLRLQSVESRLLSQFSALDSIISGLTATSDFLTSQLVTPSSG